MTSASQKLEVIILGSGPSCTTPNLACLTRDETSVNPPCRCCASIYEDTEDAKAAGGKRNIRGNISAVVRKTWADGKQRYVILLEGAERSADRGIAVLSSSTAARRSTVPWWITFRRMVSGRLTVSLETKLDNALMLIVCSVFLAVLLTHDHADGESPCLRSRTTRLITPCLSHDGNGRSARVDVAKVDPGDSARLLRPEDVFDPQ
jgi:hypothetical protein